MISALVWLLGLHVIAFSAVIGCASQHSSQSSPDSAVAPSRQINREPDIKCERFISEKTFRALSLCLDSHPAQAAPVFDQLIAAKSTVMIREAWQLASERPSQAMRQAMIKRLALVVQSSPDELIVYPEVAKAIVANNLQEGYAFLRPALDKTGHKVYVDAMIRLKPEESSNDLLRYLATGKPCRVSGDLPFKVSCPSVLLILEHLEAFPPSPLSPYLTHLISFALADDQAIAAKALSVLLAIMALNPDRLAFVLAGSDPPIRTHLLAKLAPYQNAKTKRFFERVQYELNLQKKTPT